MTLSSEYPVLDNRPIDQWKVTELKEELKRRKLTTRGLKEELVRRLDEDIRKEMEAEKQEADNGVEEVSPNNVTGDATMEEIAGFETGGLTLGNSEFAVEVGDDDDDGIVVSDDVSGQVEIGDSVEQAVKRKSIEEGQLGQVSDPVLEEGTLADGGIVKLDDVSWQVETGDIVEQAVKRKSDEEQQLGLDSDLVLEEGTLADGGFDKLDEVSGQVETGDIVEQAVKRKSNEEQQLGLDSDLVLGEGTLADGGTVKLDDVLGQVEIEDSIEPSVERKSDEEQQLGLGSDHILEEGTIVMNDAPSIDLGNEISENISSEKAVDGEGFQDGKMGRDDEGLRAQEQPENVKPLHQDGKLDSSESYNQVSEVSCSLGFPVKSNFVSNDDVSFNEKNELKDNIIDDSVKLESDVMPEMVQPSSSDIVPDGGDSHPSDVEEPHENKGSVHDTDNIVANAKVSQKNYGADLGSSEKLNLDRSSGDDFMEEDALENKHIDSNFISEEVVEKNEKNDSIVLERETLFPTMDIDGPANDKSIHSKNDCVADASTSTDKRKLSDQVADLGTEPTKRQRKWKSESNSFKEPQIPNIPLQSAVKDVSQPVVLKRNFSGSKSTIGVEEPFKEREVPPSSKPATNSLRIDRFLRPFTLKAVQELLAKTGTVASFWMDNIKTHCYVSYSSVEEAVETRNALYNLQWPPNGGRHLVADFVDPDEAKARLELPPPPSLAPPVSSSPKVPEPPSTLPQPSPRQQSLKKQVTQPPTLPPPPPLTTPPQAREQAFPSPLPQHEKVEAPIVTLDDLFRKTKATPRIYYLPLSEVQVSAVLEARQSRRGNSTKQ